MILRRYEVRVRGKHSMKDMIQPSRCFTLIGARSECKSQHQSLITLGLLGWETYIWDRKEERIIV